VHVAIDIQGLLRQKTGVGHALYDLIEAIATLSAKPESGSLDDITAFYFSRHRNRIGLPFCHAHFHERRIGFPPARLLSAVWKHCHALPVDRFFSGADLYHFPDFVARPVKQGKIIVTVHDLSFVRLPETVEPKNRAYLAKNVPASLDRAEAVIAVSDFTRREIETLFPATCGKVHVIYHGVRRIFRPLDPTNAEHAPSTPGLPARYVLAVGTVEPRKNLGLLLDAMDTLRRDPAYSNVGLVVAGGRGWLSDTIEQRLADGQQDGHLVRLGYVTDDELRRLYCHAALLAFPTKYEGFGLPALEAMACGLPVIASRVASLPEVVGDAALLVEQPTPDAFADTIRSVLANDDLAADLSQRGLERARRFSWQQAAQQTLDLYRHVMEGRNAHRD